MCFINSTSYLSSLLLYQIPRTNAKPHSAQPDLSIILREIWILCSLVMPRGKVFCIQLCSIPALSSLAAIATLHAGVVQKSASKQPMPSLVSHHQAVEYRNLTLPRHW